MHIARSRSFGGVAVRALLALTLAGCLAGLPEPPLDEPTVDESPPTAAAALTGPPPSRPLVGQQQILVLTVVISDPPRPPALSDDFLVPRRTEMLDRFAAFMAENSYGQVSFSFTTPPTVVVPASLCDPTDPLMQAANQRAVLAAAVAATDATIDYGAVHQIVMWTANENFTCPTGSSGWIRRVFPIVTGEGALDTSMTFIGQAPGMHYSVMVHEYGHSVGASHIDPHVCTIGGVRVPVVHTLADAARCAYSAPYYFDLDPLAFAGTRHFAASRKAFWGWLDLAVITSSVSADLIIRSLESPASGPRAIRVRLPASERFGAYMVEYRAGTGLDQGQAPGLYLFAEAWWPTNNAPELIDPPPYATADTHSGRPLTPGQRYRDPVYPISFQLLSTTGDLARVRVELDGKCPAAATQPCCTLTGCGVQTCSSTGSWGTCKLSGGGR